MLLLLLLLEIKVQEEQLFKRVQQEQLRLQLTLNQMELLRQAKVGNHQRKAIETDQLLEI